MAMAKVEIISKEMIKPSLPTPHTLRIHKLSLLDQIAVPVFIPLIFFYQFEPLDNIIDRTRKVQLLKQSLSNVLTRFYPLAGRWNGNISIDCNDDGVEFMEAQVTGHLSEVVESSKIEELGVLLPIEACEIENNVLLAIKVNLFDCGGMAIGVCMSHNVGDFSSIVRFINAWAAATRGDTEMVQPNFNLASLFPPVDLFNSNFTPTMGITNEKRLTRRFVFTKEKLDSLKKSVSLGSQVKDPTRVEALSTLIWKHLMDEHLKNSKLDSKIEMFCAIHAVNTRPRMDPPLSDNFFGNYATTIMALSNLKSEMGKNDLVYKLRSEIRKIDSDYIKKFQNGEKYVKNLGRVFERMVSKGETEFCYFTSWCRFPVYEADFGWGTPIRVCPTTVPLKNCVILMSTKCGEGIEAYINMLNEDGFSKALM